MNDQLRKIPNHVAIIMDGNGRWAKAKGKNRIYGHNSAKASTNTLGCRHGIRCWGFNCTAHRDLFGIQTVFCI